MKNSVWLIEDWSEKFCDQPEYYGVVKTKKEADKELKRLNGIAYREQLNRWREDRERIKSGENLIGVTIHPEESFYMKYHAVEVPLILCSE